jgi:hypothetical protein
MMVKCLDLNCLLEKTTQLAADNHPILLSKFIIVAVVMCFCLQIALAKPGACLWPTLMASVIIEKIVSKGIPMILPRHYVLCAAFGLLLVTLGGCKALSGDEAAVAQNITSTETAARTVEDGGTGPYSAVMVTDSTLATHTIFRPKDLSVFGKNNKLPIIAWGNGACANSPWEHVNFLSEVASHGFLVIAIGPMPQEGKRGGGRSTSSQLIDAMNWAIAQNSDKTSQYFNKIDTTKIAVSGMSCGGLQTLEVAPDPRVTTAMICNSGILSTPGSGMPGMPNLKKDQLEKLHSPAIYILGGESDIAYNNGMDDFRRINHVPVFAANLNVGHGGTYGRPHGGDFAKVATAWFQWQLKENKEAAKMFVNDPCGVAQMAGWKVEKKNIR